MEIEQSNLAACRSASLSRTSKRRLADPLGLPDIAPWQVRANHQAGLRWIRPIEAARSASFSWWVRVSLTELSRQPSGVRTATLS
jgi:hypothetical protein